MTLAVALTAATAWAQTLNIGGHRAPLDTLNNIWLCSIPQACFGNDFSATVSFGGELSDMTIDDIAINNGDEFTFAAIEGGKLYNVSVQMGDSIFNGAITFTWLPILELKGSFNNNYKIGTVIVSEPDSAYAEPMLAKLKWRGRATNAAGKHKRNYHIKFLDEDSVTKVNRRFFGLRNDNSWILDAGQMDFLRVRNRVSTDLWLDMARRPWYSDTLPNAHNGSRGQMVEVLLNGAYVGIYNMCEPIDRKQLKVKRYEYDENRKVIFHGEIWDAFTWTRTVTMSKPEPRNPGARIWDGFELKYPDWDDIHTVKWTALENAVWFANRVGDNYLLGIDSMEYYFDVPVMQDYLIFITALQALDNESKNIYYAVYDEQTHPRLTMVPWDLDICLGQNFTPSADIPEMVKPDRPLDWISHMPMAEMMDIQVFGEQIVQRYRELRQTVLNTENMVSRYRNAINELENCGAAAREENRWSGDQDLAGKVLDLSAEMDYVENWIRQRMAYVDENIFIDREYPDPNPHPDPIPGDVNLDGEVNIADINIVIGIILGRQYDSDTVGRADVNKDGEVNIADINAIIQIILN